MGTSPCLLIMKTFHYVAALLAVVPALLGEIQMTGVLNEGGSLLFCLRETKTGDKANWIKVGDTFAGYTLERYDAQASCLVLRSSEDVVRVKLLTSKTGGGDATLTAEERALLHKKILNNLRQLAAAADQYYLENGATTVRFEELVGDTKFIRKLEPVDGENYSTLTFAMGTPLSIVSRRGITVTYAP